MPIFTEFTNQTGPRRAEDFPVTAGEALAARFGASFDLAPTSSASRFIQRELVAGPERRGQLFGVIGGILFGGNPIGFIEGSLLGIATDKPRSTLTAEQANNIAGHLGLKFDKPITVDEFDLIVRQKERSLRHESARQRESDSLLFGVVGFGVELFAQAIDLSNIAVSFIPIVGEARFLNMAARIGLGRARFARGAVEGFVGNLMIEPIVAINATREQADYQMTDSLLNLAFGTLIGGGLHTFGGRGRDILRGRTPLDDLELREKAVRRPQTLDDLADLEGRPPVRPEDVLTPEDISVIRGADEGPAARSNAEIVDGFSEAKKAKVLGASVVQVVEGKNVDIAPALTPDRPIDVDEIVRKSNDPDNVRLATRSAAERLDEQVKEARPIETPEQLTTNLDEDLAVFRENARQLADDKVGKEVLERAGISIDKEGNPVFQGIVDADLDIEKSIQLTRAAKLLPDCILKNG